MQKEAFSEEVELEQESMETCCKNEAWIALFLKHQEDRGYSPHTLKGNRHRLGYYWMRFLREKKITVMDAQSVAQYQAWLYDYRGPRGKPLARASQISLLAILRTFFGFLFRQGLLPNDPTFSLRLPRPLKTLPGKTLLPREVKKLLAQPDTTKILGFRDRALLEVLYATGIRTGELTRLRVKDVNFCDGVLFVIESKGGKERNVPLGKNALQYLKVYVESVHPLLKAEDEILFPNRRGKCFNPVGLLKKIQIYTTRAGIKKHVTVHTFRHTLATEMLKGGADLRQIQEMLGHKKITTTEIYTHVFKGELKRVQQHCHPREQSELPRGFVSYHGREYLTDFERNTNVMIPPR